MDFLYVDSFFKVIRKKIRQTISLTFVLGIVTFLGTGLAAQQVGIDKAVNTSTPLTGEQITYQLDFGCSSLTTDCIGAKVIDTLPAVLTFISANPVIVQSSGGPIAVSPIYDPVAHVLMYDFTTLPEMGLPDGFSGTAFFTMEVPAGITPNASDINNTARIVSDNAGADEDSAPITTQASPQWSLSKSADQQIFHDRDITYTIQLCSDATLGNLDLYNIVIKDTLPAGADFVSTTNGGVWDGNDPGVITWTIDTMRITDGCASMDVVVNYPSIDMVENNTGLVTSINKINTVTSTADPVGEPPLVLMDAISDPLLPPEFNLGIRKEAADNGILPLERINYFDFNVSNPSTVPVDSFIVYDAIPPQFDLSHIRFTDFPLMGQTVRINIELNDNGILIPWDTTNTTVELLDTASLPYDPTIDYISAVQFDFGTVASGFGGTIRLVVTPAWTGDIGSAVDNAGNPVELYTPYENCVELTAIRPLDGALLTTMPSCDDMCFQDTVARMAPDKSVVSSNEMPPDGDMTTGNPYLPDSKVTYTLHIENDGADGMEEDNNGPISNDTLHNPIGADLLPIGLSYILDSWKIVNNTTDLTLDTLGGNPMFEIIDNFNGTGQTLLRWQFIGDFAVEDYVDISFDARIDAVSGESMVNTFCLSAAQDFYCDAEDCGLTDTTNINNFFGDTGTPSILISGINEMCCASSSFTVADSTAVIGGDKNLLTAAPYAPTGTDIVELGLATDTLKFETTLSNAQQANVVLPNPIGSDLLPLELEYVDGSIVLENNTTGLTLSDDGSNPTIEVIRDYAGTGRTLLRWTYDGDFPINSGVTYSFKTYIKAGAGGIITNDFLYNSSDQFFNCLTGVSVTDDLDLDGDGDIGELLCKSSSPPIPIQSVSSLSAKKFVKGVCDTAYLELPDIASTFPNDSVLWRLNVLNAGNIALSELVIIDVFSYIGDVGVQLNTSARETGWRPYLIEPITLPAGLNMTVYYSQEQNPCRPEIEPNTAAGCVDDWSTTPPVDLATVQAIKLALNDTLQPADEFFIDVKMFSPDSAAITNPIAWNSIARNAKELPAQEPNKVGIRLKYFDLALTKTLKSGFANPFEVNDTVTFSIDVFNQSESEVKDVELIDYIPDGLTLVDNNWTLVNDSTAIYTIAETILGGASTNIDIKMVINRDVAGDTLVNFAEITAAKDSLDNVIPDFDSTPDADRTNDLSDIDNNTEGNTPTDEDDHDGEQIIVLPCEITSLNFTTECLDNDTPLDPTDDRFIIHLQPTGTSLSGTYSVTMGFMTMDSIAYDSVFSSESDSTFMAVMGGLTITIQDDSDTACIFTDSIPPPAPCSIIDLAVEKSVDTTCAESGDTVVFTVIVRKEMWDITVEDVEVRDTLPDGFTYISNTRSQGSYNANSGRWIIGTIPEGLDSVVLTITASVEDFHDGGILTNKAQVHSTDLADIDSTPGNNVESEDDIDFACVSVPMYVCPDLQDSLLLSAPIGSTNVEWLRDTGTGTFSVGSGIDYYAKAAGTYTFTADALLCEGGKCCPFYVREGCFDLALKKTLADTQVDSVLPGENVTFTIKIYNQGDFDAYDIEVKDYLPNYLTLSDNDWTNNNDSTATYTIAGPLVVGDSLDFDITTQVDLNYQDSLLINFAEISDATDRPGGATAADRDSEPDANRVGDTGGEPDGVTDNEVNSTPPTDEDDHDPASIKVHQIFDLALKKTLADGQPSTVTWLDTVTYELTIYNQGTLHAYDVEISDYVPDSMILADGNWVLDGDTAVTTIDTLLARDSATLEITLAVNQLFRGDSLVNFAEISFASQESGSGIPSLDEDSSPDSNDTNDGGGAVQSAADDYVDGDGMGTIGNGIATTDEDDHDPALVRVVPCSLFVTINEAICNGDSFDFNGTILSTGGAYQDTLTANIHDCDSIITLNLTILDTFQTIRNLEICLGDTLAFNNLDLYASGTHRDTLTASNSCDSFIVLNLIVRDTFQSVLNETLCQGDIRFFNDQNLSSTGTFRDTLMTIHGCDSFIVLNITAILDTFQTVLTDTICQGDNYTFNNQGLTTSGTYRDTLTALNGCDSFIIMNFIVKDTFQTPFDIAICQGDTYFFNDQNLISTGTYRDTFTAINGCDSFIVLSLLVKDTFQTIQTMEICLGDTLAFNNLDLYASGTHRDTLTASNGCDSFLVLNLIVRDTFQTVLNETLCQGDIRLFNNQNLSSTGSFRDTLTTTHGCDSFIVLNITAILDTFQTVLTDTICQGDNYIFNNQGLTISGTYRDTLTALNGCDSFIIMNFIVKDTFQTPFDIAICQGDTYFFNNQNLISTGTYRDTFTAINGCDSFIVLSLLVRDTFQTIQTMEICMGDTLAFNNQELYASGIHRDTLTAINSCDSFIVLNLTVLDTFRTILFDTTCTNVPYFFGAQNRLVTGIYLDTLSSINNCDSIIEMHLTFVDCDWGDLPDTSSITHTGDYQTQAANSGPVHLIIPGLSLGIMVDAEPDGQASTLADGDGIDEDGLTIFPTLDLAPNINFKLPLEVTNNTGETAHLEIWIDWNGDGILDDNTEKIIDLDDSGGSFPTLLSLTVPPNAATGLLGLRSRISLENNMTPYGIVKSGEIEDYLIGIKCPQVICIPATIDIKKE